MVERFLGTQALKLNKFEIITWLSLILVVCLHSEAVVQNKMGVHLGFDLGYVIAKSCNAKRDYVLKHSPRVNLAILNSLLPEANQRDHGEKPAPRDTNFAR